MPTSSQILLNNHKNFKFLLIKSKILKVLTLYKNNKINVNSFLPFVNLITILENKGC